MIKELIFKAESGQSLVDHITAESVAYLTALRYLPELVRSRFFVGFLRLCLRRLRLMELRNEA